MNRITMFGKASILALLLSLLSLTGPARGQDAGPIVIALGVLQTALTTVINEVIHATMVIMQKDQVAGLSGVRLQVSANTVGIQNALQHNAAASVQATAQQTAILADQINMLEFGDMGQITLPDGQRISANALPPSGCKRKTASAVLADSRPVRAARRTAWTAASSQYNTAPASGVGAARRLSDTPSTQLTLNWLDKETLTAQEALDASKSISSVINPDPLPTISNPSTTDAGTVEYQKKSEVYNARIATVSAALQDQLDMRAPIADGTPNSNTSVLKQINDMARNTVESKLYPDQVTAKPSSASARELVFLNSANLYVTTELLKQMQISNSLAAVAAADRLSGVDRDSMERLYQKAVVTGSK